MKPPIHLDLLEFRHIQHEDRFDAKLGAIGPLLGAKALGANLTIIAPGKCAFPRHSHRGNEELFLILEGEGEVRLGDATHPVQAGSVIFCPPGGPETAHQLRNTSDSVPLKIFAVSTRNSPDVCEYPDSGKVAILAEAPGQSPLRYVQRLDNSLGYWDGE